MRSARPRNRPLSFSPTGLRMRRFGALAARSAPGESALAMRGSRPLAPRSIAQRPGRGAVAKRPGLHADHQYDPGCRHGVINVLRHDLPRHAPRANIYAVEREATNSRNPEWARIAAPAGTERVATIGNVAAFIRRLRAPSEICAAEAASRASLGSMARIFSSGCDGSRLHLPARCTSVLVNVYSGPGATRGKGSGGVGKRHAGDGSRH
jgi:hypothetical protein